MAFKTTRVIREEVTMSDVEEARLLHRILEDKREKPPMIDGVPALTIGTTIKVGEDQEYKRRNGHAYVGRVGVVTAYPDNDGDYKVNFLNEECSGVDNEYVHYSRAVKFDLGQPIAPTPRTRHRAVNLGN